MRRLLKQILVFLIPLIVGTLLLFALPYPSSFALKYVRGECDGQSYWIQDRLHMQEPVDVLLLGSSRMIDGVDDQLLTKLLSQKQGKPVQVMNAGFCRLGRDVPWWILTQVIQQKDPRLVIIEVRESEPQMGHPVFGYFASTEQLLGMPVLQSGRYFENWYHGLLSRLDRFRYGINDFEMERPWHPHPLYGHGAWPEAVDTIQLQAILKESRDREKATQPSLPRISKTYLSRIQHIAEEYEIKLYFLYLPSLGSANAVPAQKDYFEKHAQLLAPPDSLRDSWYFYRDGEHLNSTGATWLTQWLAEQLGG